MRVRMTVRLPGLALLSSLMMSAALAQTPPMAPDIPAKFDAPTDAADYIKRDVMIPMRDGVKLHTVIVIPKGAQHAPIILTRTPTTRRSARSAASARTCRPSCRRATRCWPAPATSACSRTCAANTVPKAST